MTFCPVSRSVDEHLESLEEKPWHKRVRITLQLEPDVTVEADFDLDHAHDDKHAIEQIRDIIAHQTHIQII